MLYVRFKCSASGNFRALPKFAGRATNLFKVEKTLTPSMSSPLVLLQGNRYFRTMLASRVRS